jgi:predicted RNase H-like HicB family nuclease
LKEKSKYRYEIIIYWSEDDQAYIAEVPELPGCAADGPNYQEALSQAEIIIDEWVETAKGLGRPVPDPRGRLLFA